MAFFEESIHLDIVSFQKTLRTEFLLHYEEYILLSFVKITFEWCRHLFPKHFLVLNVRPDIKSIRHQIEHLISTKINPLV